MKKFILTVALIAVGLLGALRAGQAPTATATCCDGGDCCGGGACCVSK